MMVFQRTPWPALAVALLGLLLAPASVAKELGEAPYRPGDYVVEDGKVDPNTYEGYIVYTRACMACHGPDGLGSSFAPSLIRAAERRGWADFAGTVAAGREVQPGQVMPSFADDPYVMRNIPYIFSYMLARGEGGLGRGRPQIIESMQDEAESGDGDQDD
ncbi:c-type cytochrome [Halomonas sp. 3H]|jgi:mono/diheme cytochrome c family protein|uniref:c-type cytochrome n=1 Tax=Halomonas TaxID=2745 RepID=UPI0020B6A53B|nr:c-type cytochrome [Halomonas sp. 3H]